MFYSVIYLRNLVTNDVLENHKILTKKPLNIYIVIFDLLGPCCDQLSLC